MASQKYKLNRAPFKKVFLVETTSNPNGKTLEELVEMNLGKNRFLNFIGDCARFVGKGCGKTIALASLLGALSSLNCYEKHKIESFRNISSEFQVPETNELHVNPVTGMEQSNYLIVQVERGTSEEQILQIAYECNARVVAYDSDSGLVQFEADSLDKLEQELTKYSEVQESIPDIVFSDAAYPNDPLDPGWWVLRGASLTGKYGMCLEWYWRNRDPYLSAEVMIIDGKFNPNHEDLKDNIVSSSFISSASLRKRKSSFHGNQVAGIIGAVFNNGMGIPVSRNKLNLLGIYGLMSEIAKRLKEIRNDDGETKIVYLGKALKWPFPLPPDADALINRMSPILRRLFSMYGRNTLFFIPAGNDGIEAKYGCGILPEHRPWNVIVVGGDSGEEDPFVPGIAKWDKSNWGPPVTLYCPGSGPFTTTDGTGYVDVAGTSFSAAMAALVASLVKANFPTMTAREIAAFMTCLRQGREVPEHQIKREVFRPYIDKLFELIEQFPTVIGFPIDDECWFAETVVKDNISGNLTSNLAGVSSNKNGITHLVFGTNDGTGHLWYLTWDGSNATLEELVSLDVNSVSVTCNTIPREVIYRRYAGGSEPKLRFEDLFVVYESNGQIFLKKKDENGWQSEQYVANGTGPHITYKNGLHLVFQQGNKIIYGFNSGNSWKFTTITNNAVGDAMPKIAVNEYGDVGVFWKENNDVYFRVAIGGKIWCTKKNISKTPLTEPLAFYVAANKVMKEWSVIWNENEGTKKPIYVARKLFVVPGFKISKIAEDSEKLSAALLDLDSRWVYGDSAGIHADGWDGKSTRPFVPDVIVSNRRELGVGGVCNNCYRGFKVIQNGSSITIACLERLRP